MGWKRIDGGGVDLTTLVLALWIQETNPERAKKLRGRRGKLVLNRR
jgi:hypothetical protein